jgi:hypothetical protein
MSTAINYGRNTRVMNVTLSSTADTAITINNKYVNAAIVQCRTAVDMYFRREQGDSEYFTIKSGTVLTLNLQPTENEPFYLRAASATPVAEILLFIE